MMDAKTAMKVLVDNKCGDCVMLAPHQATEIGALIDRQKTKIAEQEKYAELGRLFAECSVKCEKENCCLISLCDISKACQKRAELQRVEAVQS